MPLQGKLQFTRKDLARLSLLLAAAVTAGWLERLLPLDFAAPGVKLGLPNIVILTALYQLPFPWVLLLAVAKCLVLALLSGNLLALWFGVAGSVLSLLAMRAVKAVSSVSPVGVSVTGAVFHNVSQLTVAAVMVQSLSVAAYLPLLTISGVLAGALVGVAAGQVIQKFPGMFKAD